MLSLSLGLPPISIMYIYIHIFYPSSTIRVSVSSPQARHWYRREGYGSLNVRGNLPPEPGAKNLDT